MRCWGFYRANPLHPKSRPSQLKINHRLSRPLFYKRIATTKNNPKLVRDINKKLLGLKFAALFRRILLEVFLRYDESYETF